MILSPARRGPFISGGARHTVLQLGQKLTYDDDGTFGGKRHIDDDQTDKLRSVAGAKRGRTGITLKDLVDAGVVVPGRNKISVLYKGTTYTATLSKEGFIIYQGERFMSATAFSIHCKRQQTPNKQGDDGWKSVLYEGLALDTFRRRLLSKSGDALDLPINDEADVEDGLVDDALADDATELGEAAGDDTDQWVQCDRCKTWRIVPDSDWAAVEADPREDWLCDYATWDLTEHTPFTPACSQDPA